MCTQEPSAEELGPESVAKLSAHLDRLQEAAAERLRKQVLPWGPLSTYRLHLT